MKILITQSTVVDRQQIAAGETCEASEATAKLLILMGKAQAFAEELIEPSGVEQATQRTSDTAAAGPQASPNKRRRAQ